MKRVMMLWLLVITLPTFAQRNNLLSLTEGQQGWALLFGCLGLATLGVA